MARPTKKSTAEKISEQLDKITKTEELLVNLKKELKELEDQKDKEDMQMLLSKMKESKLTIEQAIELLQNK